MTFFQHLEELRTTLIRMAIVMLASAIAAWFVSEPILNILVTPDLGQVHYFSPTEGFLIRVKVSLVTGLLVAIPILLAQIWSFVAPGLFQRERRTVAPVLLGSTTLFYFGVVFAYMGVVPKTIGFLLSFAGERLTPVINVTQYFMFVAKFCFAFGVVFQLPLVVVMLSALGLVSPQRLWKTWRYGILIIFVFAAWLTPPDAVSQVLMAGPIIVLYLASIGLAFLLARRRRRRQ
jgi:sec-independent protein translocase protein TatC